MKKFSLFLLMTLTCLVSRLPLAEAGGPTKVSGVINANTTWTLNDSPIIITGKTLVPDGVTLKIEPGVEVKFDGFFTLVIEGVLIARGTKNQMIKFTSNLMNPKAGDWDAIYFANGFDKNGAVVDQNDNYVSGSIISYAEISFGGAIQLNYNAYLSNNYVHDMKGEPILNWGNNAVAGAIAIAGCPNNFCAYIVKDNIISHNGGSGIASIALMGSNVKIIGNTIQRNKGSQGGGVNCSGGIRCALQDNIILQNEAGVGGGVYLETYPSASHNAIANNCVTSVLIPDADWYKAANGAAVAARDNLKLENNSIVGNFSGAQGPSSAMLHFYYAQTDKWNHNNISNPTTYEIYEETPTRPNFIPNAILDATNNFWGTTDPTVISARIWDVDDDFDLPKVDFLPILQQPELAAPKLDPKMLEPMACGCGVANTDTDGDGFADCNDQCPKDKNKQVVGLCGCGVADTDTDMDGTADCKDLCPKDKAKLDPGLCGCGVADTDTDMDGTADCKDLCPNDKNKQAPGVCGCGVLDLDSDQDGVMDCKDQCPFDKNKQAPGVCGCGVPDVDMDMDGIMDCQDLCPQDPKKKAPGSCGCGIPDVDSDGDMVMDCKDLCPNDKDKQAPGVCGCGTPDTDSDGDLVADCKDQCPQDKGKQAPGVCGCGVADTDTDMDGTADCKDQCPNDRMKQLPGVCGCGVPDVDSDLDGILDCRDQCPQDKNKQLPGVCGCGMADIDSDNDGWLDCKDQCPNDPKKVQPGICGCGVQEDNSDQDNDGVPDCRDQCPGAPDTDTDLDGTADCKDQCSSDPGKIDPGICGCGTPDPNFDVNKDGKIDKLDCGGFLLNGKIEMPHQVPISADPLWDPVPDTDGGGPVGPIGRGIVPPSGGEGTTQTSEGVGTTSQPTTWWGGVTNWFSSWFSD